MTSLRRLIVALVALSLGSLGMVGLAAPAQAGKIGASWFGIAFHQAAGEPTPYPAVPVSALLVNASWRQIETSPGVYDFGTLRRLVDAASAHGDRPTLVMGSTPEFYASDFPDTIEFAGPGSTTMPKDIQTWINYVRALAREFGTTVDYLPWNEPCIIEFWSGTMPQMAELVQSASVVLTAEAEPATFLAPSCPARKKYQQALISQMYAQEVGGKPLASWVDAVPVNAYPLENQGPEDAHALFQKVQGILKQQGVKKPIWVTEINYGVGGVNEAAVISERKQAENVAKTLPLFASLGVKKLMWFGWDVKWVNTFLTPFGVFTRLTRAGRTWSVARKWILGTTVTCARKSSGVWTCTAKNSKGVRRIYFRAKGTSTIAPPAGARTRQDMDGITTRLRAGAKITVTTSPVMVK